MALFRSIGVSNFNVADLKILLESAKIKPVVNQVRHPAPNVFTSSYHHIHAPVQILVHPYVYAQQEPIISYGLKNGIITEAYSSLLYALFPICFPCQVVYT